MSIKTPLSRVRGLGAAKDGVAHFWAQRVSALALVPLAIWFLASLAAYAGANYQSVTDYIGDPINAVLLILFLATAFYHMKLGLKVVIEDYIQREGTKIALFILLDFYTYAFGGIAIFSVLSIAFQTG